MQAAKQECVKAEREAEETGESKGYGRASSTSAISDASQVPNSKLQASSSKFQTPRFELQKECRLCRHMLEWGISKPRGKEKLGDSSKTLEQERRCCKSIHDTNMINISHLSSTLLDSEIRTPLRLSDH